MKYMLLVYVDESLMQALPAGDFDTKMRACLEKADEEKRAGRYLDFQQLEAPTTAKTVRIRNGRTAITDGPFAEAKEVLGGFNLVEAESEEEALRMAAELPWAATGSIEVRPVRDIDQVRVRVGAASAQANA
ncbi:MAG TPA: YciI family protein [Gemmatimonadaceae bacterium]|nr:YciI family protein [Gemmatimonadaceae bacterium]